MTDFTFHTPESAPEAARPLLRGAHAKLGFVPNLYAGLAEAPAALNGYFQLSDRVAETSLTPIEQQVLALAVSAANGCTYCMAAHSTIARTMVGAPDEVVDALRSGQPIADPKLQALREFAEAVVRERGDVQGALLESFVAAGYQRQQVLEVLLVVAMKTLSNYANHLLDTPVDVAFRSESWSPAGAADSGG
jgi:uncharacterized peroxidase-related enzyme